MPQTRVGCSQRTVASLHLLLGVLVSLGVALPLRGSGHLSAGFEAGPGAAAGTGALCVATDAPRFTIAMLPDTQAYHRENYSGFADQVGWIRSQHLDGPEPIEFVTHVGDIVECGRGLPSYPSRLCAIPCDPFNRFEWTNSSHAMSQLDSLDLPYSVVLGNHDRDDPGAADNKETRSFDSYFGAARFDHRAWNAGSFSKSRAQLFTADGRVFLHIGIEFAPDRAVLDWAMDLLERHPTHPAIVTTHEGLTFSCPGPNGPRWGCDCEGDPRTKPTLRHIAEFAAEAPNNLFLILSGHVSCSAKKDLLNEAALLVKRGSKNPVWAVMSDYSDRANGGDGMLRLLRFYSAGESTYRVMAQPCSTFNESATPGTPFEQRLEVVARPRP